MVVPRLTLTSVWNQEKSMSSVMIWGGTRGLGREIARASLERGHRTTVTGRTRPTTLEGGLEFVEAHFDHFRFDDGFIERSVEADILFWVAGHWLRKPLPECSEEELRRLFDVHQTTPILYFMQVLKERPAASREQLHLVTVASSSAWKLRADGQAAYGAVQAGKVQFARNLHAESSTLIAKSTIVRPGGMKTEFFDGSDVNTSSFADPAEVAAEVWKYVDGNRPSTLVELDIAQMDGRLSVRAFDRDGNPWSFEAHNPQ